LRNGKPKLHRENKITPKYKNPKNKKRAFKPKIKNFISKFKKNEKKR